MDEKIKVLKEKLQYIGTRDLLGMIGIHFITFANGASDMAEQSDIFNKTNLIKNITLTSYTKYGCYY